MVLTSDLFIPFLRFQEDGIDVLHVLFEELDGLCEQFVAFTEVVGLLVAARYVIRDNTDEYRLNQNPLLLVLDREDFQCFLKCTQ